MRIIPKLLFLWALLIPFLCRAQKGDSTRHNMVKINPVSLFDEFSFPTLQIAYERQLGRHTSLSADVGYQTYSQHDTTYTPGFKAALEFRLYNWLEWFELWGNPEFGNMEGLYIGINLFYRANKYDYSMHYYKEDDRQIFGSWGNRLYDGIGVNTKIIGSNFLFGYQGEVVSNVTVDVFGGVGAMYRNVVNTNREMGTNDKVAGRFFNFLGKSKHLSESTGGAINLVMGLRIGYRF